EPGTEEPGTEEPGTEEPGTEEPGTEEPGTEEPGPVTYEPITDFISISAGVMHSCGLTTEGGIKCWGKNTRGQLGDGTSIDSLIPVNVSGLDSGVVSVSVGYDHTCALLDTGGMQCWGSNQFGQLGNGETLLLNGSSQASRLPVDVSGLNSGVAKISVGQRISCAVLDNGSVKCWGYNVFGQLGDGTKTHSSVPVNASGLNSGIVDISLGGSHSCVLLDTGGMKCWGNNSNGQLGDGTRNLSLTPVNVSGLSSGIVDISLGNAYSCALLDSGTIECWGANYNGQLGNLTAKYSVIPVKVSGLNSGIVSISSGNNHSCALLDNGSVKCWGLNTWGQLGDGTTNESFEPINVTGLSGVSGISGGSDYTCALLNTGSIKCWGSNPYGQLGDGTIYNYTELFLSQLEGLPNNIQHKTNTIGSSYSCLITTSGGVKCWGYNRFGQLGDGTKSNKFLPVDVVGLNSGVVNIFLGMSHACAILDTGGVKCWGSNSSGQLGDGTKQTDRLIPVDVSGLNSGVVNMSLGSNNSCALLDNGGIQCWGNNANGQLGNGTTNKSLTPVNVSGLNNGVSNISTGYDHSCALLDNGSVKCWGPNQSGQLGNGTNSGSLVPVNVDGLSSNIISINLIARKSCALTVDGGIQCWGEDRGGLLGDGTTTNKTIATDVIGLTNGVTTIYNTESNICAILVGGGIKCVGTNYSGQLGTGTTSSQKISVDIQGINNPVAIYGTRNSLYFRQSDGIVKYAGRGYYNSFLSGYDFFLKRDVSD
ncbi:MAG: RCC1 repeat-containing protein, partial [Candidatus Gracilibacteria bacterium]